MCARGLKEGPDIWLTACGHGEEIGGMAIIHEVFRKLRKKSLLKGTINAIPLMNPIGFETANRFISLSGEDLNRSFPGKATGSLGQRIAEKIFSTILENKPSLVIDLHHDWIHSVPYGLLDAPIPDLDPEAMSLCGEYLKKTGILVVRDSETVYGSLSHACLREKIPAITLELGESYVINEKNIILGLSAIWNLLVYLEMVEPLEERFPIMPDRKKSGWGELMYHNLPLTTKAGIIRYFVEPGDRIRERQKIAQVYDIFGRPIETLYGKHSGILLGHADNSAVYPGKQVFAFGYQLPKTDAI